MKSAEIAIACAVCAAIGWCVGDAGHFSRFCESNLYWRNEAAHWYSAYLELGGDPDSLKPRKLMEESE